MVAGRQTSPLQNKRLSISFRTTYLLNNLLTELLSYLITHLFNYVFTSLSNYLLTHLIIWLLTYLIMFLFTYLLIYLFSYLRKIITQQIYTLLNRVIRCGCACLPAAILSVTIKDLYTYRIHQLDQLSLFKRLTLFTFRTFPFMWQPKILPFIC